MLPAEGQAEPQDHRYQKMLAECVRVQLERSICVVVFAIQIQFFVLTEAATITCLLAVTFLTASWDTWLASKEDLEHIFPKWFSILSLQTASILELSSAALQQQLTH